MAEWLEEVEGLTLKGKISVPYTWWVGETGSRFLLALRDEEKILGNRCARCNRVYVPPRKNCGRCFADLEEWVEVGKEGVVTAYTIVRFAYPLQPAKVPFAFSIIRLDGADVGLVHLVKDDLDKLRNGARARAVFRQERTGHILDIDSFKIVSD
jgi:hypothetical protein